MIKIFTVLLPMFIIIGLGYWMTRIELFSEKGLAAFGRFVISVALPALIFKSLASHELSEIFLWPYLLGYGIASMVLMGIGIFLAKLRGANLTAAALDGIGGAYSNSAFIGFPLLLGVIGTSGNLYFSINILFESLILIPSFLIIVEFALSKEKGEKVRIIPIFINMLRKPLILSLIFGLLFSLLHLKLPAPIEKSIDILSAGAAPLALFIIGGGLYGLRLKGSLPDIIQICSFKLIFMPIVVFIAVWLLGGRGMTLYAATLMAGVPLANTTVIFCQFYGKPNRGTASMLVTTCVSIITLSIIFALHDVIE